MLGEAQKQIVGQLLSRDTALQVRRFRDPMVRPVLLLEDAAKLACYPGQLGRLAGNPPPDISQVEALGSTGLPDKGVRGRVGIDPQDVLVQLSEQIEDVVPRSNRLARGPNWE
jgi:hypothetical protein